MSKKLVVLCVTLMLVCTAQAAAPKLIGSWETLTNEGWSDHVADAGTGWSATVYVDDPTLYKSRYWFSDDWSTDGDYSLQTKVTGWSWYPRVDFHTDYMNYSKIEFDIYASNTSAQKDAVGNDLPNGTATWAQIQQIAFSTQTNGWFNPGASTGFNIGIGGAPTHCVLDYSAYKTSAYFNTTDGYGSAIFALNADATTYFYIDNVQLTGVPEPATMSLLGLGGLALLRRKK